MNKWCPQDRISFHIIRWDACGSRKRQHSQVQRPRGLFGGQLPRAVLGQVLVEILNHGVGGLLSNIPQGTYHAGEACDLHGACQRLGLVLQPLDAAMSDEAGGQKGQGRRLLVDSLQPFHSHGLRLPVRHEKHALRRIVVVRLAMAGKVD